MELAHELEAAIASMDDPVRAAFLLSRHHDLRYAEIAGVLAVSVRTVEARLSQALALLRDRLKPFLEKK